MEFFTIVAIQAALQAGEILRKGFGSKYESTTKEGCQNLVTTYDLLAEKAILSFLKSYFPEHGFLAEESGLSSNPKSPFLWIIDPLDGTVNFAHNIPWFSVSIALAKEETLLSGVIYHPLTHELFLAQKNQGAFLNGTPLKVSTTNQIEAALLATGFPYNVDKNPHHCQETFTSFLQKGVPLRRMGSAALDLAYVAAGRFDGYWEAELSPWDVAAGKLLIEEAGGTVSLYDGSKRPLLGKQPLLATNGLLHPYMISQLCHKY